VRGREPDAERDRSSATDPDRSPPAPQILPDDERVLVERILAGDDAAFRGLVERFQPRLFRLVHGILGDRDVSDEVCQDVFVSAYGGLRSFDGRSSLWTWLYRVAVHAALKARRREARYRQGRSAEGPIAAEIAARTGTERREASGDLFEKTFEEKEVVAKLLRPLPEHLRVVVWLKEREGLSYREIAEILDCTVGAVEQRLHRAFVQLRSIWADRLDDLGLER
jgi:RNA polymerase sigma-70 factor (ECF subfamily)